MKSRINRFDLMTLFFLLSFILCAAAHITEGGREDKSELAAFLIKTELNRGRVSAGDTVVLYGEECEVIGASGWHLVILANGMRTEHGFLLGKTKYLFENQPLSIHFGDETIRGRIQTEL